MFPEQERALDYLARRGTLAPVEKLRAQLRDAFEEVERAFDEVPPQQRDSSPAPGKWSPHEILDHLVLSHGPAIPPFASLLAGIDAEGDAVAADLHRDERPPWDELRAQLGGVHRELLRLIDSASDQTSLEPKATVEMVVKASGRPLHWRERLDWKAFIQTIRVHTIEHRHQLQRALNPESEHPAR